MAADSAISLGDFKAAYLENYIPCGSSSDVYAGTRSILPQTYLEYAREDLEDGRESRNLINAVGNAKRAFHLQVELLCDAFAFKVVNRQRHPNFGVLLDYLRNCGVVSPNILGRLNKTRNKVEHEYIVPSEEAVEDYADIVELFLMATKDLLDRFPTYIEYELMEDDALDYSLNLPRVFKAEIRMTSGGIVLSSREEEKILAPADADYFVWLSAIVRNYKI
jgi:hypothetical protein